jgi:UDP-glucose 4-epimerase
VQPTLQDRRVLVTGGAGFIGGHLVDALADDNDVRVLDNGRTGDPADLPEEVEFVDGDVRDADAVERATADADVIFHEAAVVSVAESVEKPAQSNDINLSGTVTVLEAARRADARVVFASSAAVYGHPERVPVSEDDPTDPLSPYALQKLAADRYVRMYADRYGLPTVALRYFNVYGPGQTAGDYAGVIIAFLNRLREGKSPVVHGDGTQTRDFVHISDIVRANLRAATTDATGEAYNVGTGESVTINELADLLIDASGVDVEREHGPAREGDVDESEADVSKARERLGYEPETTLREGLTDLVERAGGV